MNWSTLTQLILLTLAISQIVDVWFNGSIFENWRERLCPRFELFNCPYCLSFHVAWLLVFLAYGIPAIVITLAPSLAASPLCDAGWYMIMVFAAYRTSWLLNSALPSELKYDTPATALQAVDEPDEDTEHNDF